MKYLLIFLLISPIAIACDYNVNILTNQSIFFDNFEFKIQINRSSGNYSKVLIQKQITDPFNNIIKEYENSTLEIKNRKTTKYSPNLKKNQAYIIRANIFPSCNDTNKNNNEAVKEVFILGKKSQETSEIKIENILDLGKDKNAEFGQIIRVRVYVYKGNTNKKTIKVYIEKNEKITKESKVNIEEKYSTQILTIPLQINPNCNNKLDNGTYELIVQGLDQELKAPIQVINSHSCEKEKIVKNQTIFINKTKNIYINNTKCTEINLNASNSKTIYLSKKEQSQRSAVFFFCGLLVLFIIRQKIEYGK